MKSKKGKTIKRPVPYKANIPSLKESENSI